MPLYNWKLIRVKQASILIFIDFPPHFVVFFGHATHFRPHAERKNYSERGKSAMKRSEQKKTRFSCFFPSTSRKYIIFVSLTPIFISCLAFRDGYVQRFSLSLSSVPCCAAEKHEKRYEMPPRPSTPQRLT